MYLNEYEIDRAVQQWAKDPVLGPASQYLSDFRDLVNRNSDGWPYWRPASQAAKNLCTILYRAEAQSFRKEPGYIPPTIEDIKKATQPIKSLVTHFNKGQYGNYARHQIKAPTLKIER